MTALPVQLVIIPVIGHTPGGYLLVPCWTSPDSGVGPSMSHKRPTVGIDRQQTLHCVNAPAAVTLASDAGEVDGPASDSTQDRSKGNQC